MTRSRTTPPRPVDIAAVFPELAAHRRTATRLHPRPGAPGPGDSSVGGPLLWPADEPWSTCAQFHVGMVTTDGVRLGRRILERAWGRTRRGETLVLTEQEQADLKRAETPPTDEDDAKANPMPLMALAQLHARDVPGLVCPEGMDVLQVLWCPHEHDDLCLPAVHLRWRRASDVTAVLADQPEPATVEYDDYVPEPCVLHPEVITEYEYIESLPDDLRRRIEDWEEATGHDYRGELSLALGWKVGGFASWSLSGPQPVVCECGRDMKPLLTIDTCEWESPYGGSWRPVEEPEHPAGEFESLANPNMPTAIVISRGYALYVFTCPGSFDHPLRFTMQ